MTNANRNKLVVTNAVWVDPEGNLCSGSIRVDKDRLALCEGQAEPPGWKRAEGSTVLDGSGCLVLPGIIDSHTHMRQPGQSYKEGIDNGTAAALKGGVTCILDMPNNVPPCTTAQRLEHKKALFRTASRTNWGLHLQARATGAPGPQSGFAAAKVYMARSSSLDPVLRPERLAALFAQHSRVIVHAEDEGLFDNAADLHHEVRPVQAVVSALDKVEQAYLAVPAKRRPRLVLAHAATAVEVDWVARMKSQGTDVWAETCPHYLLYTQEDHLRVGARLKVNPPLRSEQDRVRLLEGVRDGIIDFLSTDHAPHTPEEKAGLRPPSGIPSIEWFGPIVFSLVERGLLDWRGYMALMCTNSACCFGIKGRDGLKQGNFADFFILGATADAGPDPIVTRAGYNPYDGYPFSNLVHATVVNGRLAWDGRDFHDTIGMEVVH